MILVLELKALTSCRSALKLLADSFWSVYSLWGVWATVGGVSAIDRSHFKVFTGVVPLLSIVMHGEFSQ